MKACGSGSATNHSALSESSAMMRLRRLVVRIEVRVEIVVFHNNNTFVLSSPNWLTTRTATRRPRVAGIGCDLKP